MYARDGLVILALPLQHSLSIAHKLHPAVDVLFLKRGKVLEVLFGFGGGGGQLQIISNLWETLRPVRWLHL